MEKKQVKICGIRQNCYALDINTSTIDTKKSKTIASYPSLEKKKLPNGYVEQVEEKDYPINSDSVSSYVDGADYRRDPATAIANSKKRVNLGDVAEVQEFLKNNPQEAVRLARNVSQTLEAFLKQSPKQPEPKKEPVQGGNE